MHRQPSFSKIARSKSSSILIKQKIQHALGKKSIDTRKNQHQKSQIIFSMKNRSKSVKSLSIKNNYPLSYINKLNYEENTKNKYSYQVFQTPQKKYINEESRNTSSLQQKQKYQIKPNYYYQSKQDKFNFKNRFIWYDYFNRELIITEKKSSIVGIKNQTKYSIEFSIKQQQKPEQLLIKKQGLKLFSLVKQKNQLEVYRKNINSKHPQKINQIQLLKGINLDFNGHLIFKDSFHQNNKLLIYFMDEFQKLEKDGVKQYQIISNIIKRKIKQIKSSESEFQKQTFLLLIECTAINSKQSKITKLSATQRIIAQKLLCNENIYKQKLVKNNSIFQHKKFIF